MYCPKCGSANDETARFCTACGLDLAGYREQWREGAGQNAAQPQAAYGRPQGQTPIYQPPPYQQQYQPVYQAPPYGVGGGYGAVPNIPSYLGWAIAVLILCFWPTGIVAVVYASRVGNRLAVGDIAGAQDASRKARIWCWVSFGLAVAGVVLAILVSIFAAAATFTVY
ncbi:MAG: CD225/dispanin family protein [Actinomycetia bacterium]|nr:CD225/dispanin family protein [Actinomycetes bacterium]